ncbi:hypothetical protein OF829_05670 [Sphingomonas sp. LB-2]|uniref:hypothetical protein n=1 Tax=Sphingomonas caeni TaxID=2984949 RepID=UPI00222E904E|nr:hypothetical protein [Sphingomonas caeni]MCW3846719.1 hypothetical protein [Sphingomonas caeni]
MTTGYAFAAAALLLAGAADSGERMITGDRTLAITAGGVPARLRIDPGAPTSPIFNPDFAARAGFRAGWIGFQARVGPVKVGGQTAVIRLDFGDGEFKRRVGWFTAPYVEGADGAAGPGALAADRVRFVLGPAMPGERSVSLPLADFGRSGMGIYLDVGGERIAVMFNLDRPRSFATASAGASIAASNGGRFDSEPARMKIHLGVERPVRHMALATPLSVGPLSIAGVMVRTGDFGSAASIPEGEADAGDPDEIVVVGAKKRKGEQRLLIGRDYLDRCSSILFDKRARRVTLSCR